MMNNGNGRHTYTSLSKAWSLAVVEKCCSRIDTVPVSATWPQPQNNATPEKQRMVATSEAYGTPPRHLMQHSKQPKQKRESKRNIMSKKQIMRKRLFVLHLVKATGNKRPRHWHAKQKIYRWYKTASPSKAVTYSSVGMDSKPRKWAECSCLYRIKRRSMRQPMKWKKQKNHCLKWSIAIQLLIQSSPCFSLTNGRSTSYAGNTLGARGKYSRQWSLLEK